MFVLQEESLFSDIGGTVGVFIGFSLITVCEFVVVIILLIRFCCEKYVCKNKNANPDEDNQTYNGHGQQRGVRKNVFDSTWDLNKT